MDFKNSADGTLILSLVIPGRPATKKTHQQIIRTRQGPRIIPSSQYLKYERLCKDPCKDAWANLGHEPLDFGLGINIKVYLDDFQIGDETGYQQAIGDIIEHWGIISNDKFLHWLSDDTHMIGIDKENPRIEIKLYRYRHPYEEYAEMKQKLKEEAEERKKKREKSKEAEDKTVEKKPRKTKKTKSAKVEEKIEKEAKPKKTRAKAKKAEDSPFDNLEWMDENRS